MKILIVHNRYQIPGGEDQVAAQEAELLRAHGHQVFTYSRDNGELKTFSLRQKLALPFWTLYNPKTYRDIRRLVRENRIDVVHVHNTLMLVSPAVYYGALRGGAAVVQTIHNFRLLCPGATFYRDDQVCEDCLKKGLSCALKHRCYRGSFPQTLCCVLSMKLHRATGIYKKLTYICLTEFNKKKLLRLKGLKPEQIFVKPNAVSVPEALVPELDRQDRVLFASRLEDLKGIRVLLEAWRLLGDQGPELLLCAGRLVPQLCGGQQAAQYPPAGKAAQRPCPQPDGHQPGSDFVDSVLRGIPAVHCGGLFRGNSGAGVQAGQRRQPGPQRGDGSEV